MLRSFLRFALVSSWMLQQVVNPVPGFSQNAPVDVPPITIRTTTRLVTVDVVVTDKKGQPVTGLKADDFTVEENGKKQKISIFVAPGADNAPKPTPAPEGILSNHPENVRPAGVPTVLLLDAANSPFKDQAYARWQMLKYVMEQGQSGRPMAVLTLSDRIQVLQQFTSDPQVLLAAIKSLRPEEQILRSAGPAPESHGIADGPKGGGSSAAMASAMAAAQQFVDIQVGYNLERRTLITIEAMKSLSRMLGGLPGRKNVVWLTASLPFDLVPEDRNVSDAELLADLPGQGRERSVNVNAAGSLAAQARQLHGQEIKEAESQLANANIAIYPIDVTGLASGMESSATQGGSVFSDTAVTDRVISGLSAQQSSQGTMREVAAQTGGRAYYNRNEIKDGIALATADDKASYEVGYYPENKKWDGKYRGIKVKVAQGDTEVRYRKGYFAIEPGPTKDHNLEQDVAAALLVNAPATQISFMAQAKPTDPGKMRVVFLVDAHTVSAEDTGGNKKLNVNFYASIYDSNGKNLGTRSTKVDNAFPPATYQQILDKGMMVPIDLDLPAGAKELRLAVLDNKTGMIGTVSGPLGQ
jgi:VWFA-related protein